MALYIIIGNLVTIYLLLEGEDIDHALMCGICWPFWLYNKIGK